MRPKNFHQRVTLEIRVFCAIKGLLEIHFRDEYGLKYTRRVGGASSCRFNNCEMTF